MNPFDASLVFKAVIEQGSLVAAADYLQISPSSVSKQIRFLEQHLKVQLLKRTTRRIQKTESGDLYYLKFRQIYSQWEDLKQQVQHTDGSPKGTLKIAAPQPVCNRLLAPVLQRLHYKYPELSIQLRAEHYERLPLDEMDISICQEIRGFNSATHTATKLTSYLNQLYAAPSYVKQHGLPKTVKDLNKFQCLFYGTHGKPVAWQFSNGRDYLSNCPLITNTTETLIVWATQGAGIAYLPPIIIQDELSRGELVPVMKKLRGKTLNTYAYHQKLDFPSANIKTALNFIRQEFGTFNGE